MAEYLIWVWLAAAFVLGAVVGSGLNVAIYRLPREKSMMWPGSHCGTCFQPVAFYDNIPLLSYWILRGRCRTCKARFSMRYFFVELFTGLAFAGLFYLDVILNISDIPAFSGAADAIQAGAVPPSAWGLWFGHCLLTAYFIVTSMCDFDDLAIPLSVTVPGTLIGLLWSVCFPWPWPNATVELQLQKLRDKEARQQWVARGGITAPGPMPQETILVGAQPWPVWHPLPESLPPGSWQLGLVTSLAGILVGSGVPRAIRFLFFLGRKREGLGLGDADLMMMAGAFLGWQAVLVAFFVSVFPGLLLGVFQLLRRGEQSLPFGPPLALGTLVTMFGWRWIGPHFQFLFFTPWLLGMLAGFGSVFLLLASFVLRIFRGRAPPEG